MGNTKEERTNTSSSFLLYIFFHALTQNPRYVVVTRNGQLVTDFSGTWIARENRRAINSPSYGKTDSIFEEER